MTELVAGIETQIDELVSNLGTVAVAALAVGSLILVFRKGWRLVKGA